MWDKLKEQLNLMKLEKKKLYLISSSEEFNTKEEYIDAIASALQGGVDIIELDEKFLPDNVVVDIANKIRMLCDEFGATFIINGRADIAKIVEADGILLEEGTISISDARLILGENALIGKVISSAQDAVNCFNKGADYFVMNFDLKSAKMNSSQNYEDFKWINENIEIPLFAIGEINSKNIGDYLQFGIKRFAIKNTLLYSQPPEEKIRELLKFIP